jgi:hypothetical protein
MKPPRPPVTLLSGDPGTVFPHRPDGTLLMSRSARRIVSLAMRVANTADGAVEHCRRPVCRTTGKCHLTYDEQGVSHCPAGFTKRATAMAWCSLCFVGELVETDWWRAEDPADEAPRRRPGGRAKSR